MTTRSLTYAKGLRRHSRFEHPWAALVGIVVAVACTTVVDGIWGGAERPALQREATSRPAPVRLVELPGRDEPAREPPSASGEAVPSLRAGQEATILVEAPVVHDDPLTSAESVVTTRPPPRPNAAGAVAPRYAGLWASHPSACLKKTAGTLLPLKISQDAAVAGRATCRFDRVEGRDEAWKVAARCSNNGETWTAAVRITLQGDRLTWASERGVQTYRRC